MLSPVVRDDLIFYGDSGRNVEAQFGISPDDYLSMHERLACLGLKVRLPDPRRQVDFVLYCSSLLDRGVDVTGIIREYSVAQRGDGTDAAHALSLTKLYYHYHQAGRDVVVYRTATGTTSADAVIDGVSCELKVRIDQTERRMEPYRHLLSEGRHDEYTDVYFSKIRSREHDLVSALPRVSEGLDQGACVYLDLSSHFHSWNFHRLLSMQKQGHIHRIHETPVAPIVGSCILFCPDNAWDRNHLGFHPRAFWAYLPFDGDLTDQGAQVVPESP